MHVLGKVFMVFAALLVVTAFVLSTMLLDIRANWKKRFETSFANVQKSRDAVRVETQKLRALEEQSAAALHNWGDAWLARNSGPQGQGGVINFGVGSAQGLGLKAVQQNRETPQVFAFALDGSNQSAYAGQFGLIRLQADNASGQLVRRPYPGEEAGWASGDYRLRDTLPAGWIHATNELNGQIDIAQRHFISQRENLRVLNEQIAKSQASLDQRYRELNGNPNAPQGASADVVDGLVATVRRLEVERNAVLANVQQLRHELNTLYVQFRETLDANRQMTDSMATAAQQAGLPAEAPAAVSAITNPQ